jgi:hypothetical protein
MRILQRTFEWLYIVMTRYKESLQRVAGVLNMQVVVIVIIQSQYVFWSTESGPIKQH